MKMFTLGQEHIMEEASKPQPVMFTAGAVPVINKKGEVSMKKVHVKRYIAGKRPEWASEDESSDEDDFKKPVEETEENEEDPSTSKADLDNMDLSNADDRRLRRLRQAVVDQTTDVEEKIRRRRVHEPEVIAEQSESEESEAEIERPARLASSAIPEEESSDEGELDDEEIERRRIMLRQRARAKLNDEEELLAIPEVEKETEVKKQTVEDEDMYTTDEDSDYTDSDEEDEGQRLKPVFVRKKDRLTIQEREKEEERQLELAEEAKKAAADRRRYTIKMIEQDTRAELEALTAADTQSVLDKALQAIDSDDGNDEAEYEGWKLRELKRVKRDREEREAMNKEREEIERLSKMTPEERHAALRNQPKKVTNEKTKGKYRFLQKYYHRGAFFMEKEEDIFSRNFAQPTLDDHFDKTILPKVMQVKNFGRSGRTKYTHLVDQDTTNFDSPWSLDASSSSKFTATRAAGMKQVFDRPTKKKRGDE